MNVFTRKPKTDQAVHSNGHHVRGGAKPRSAAGEIIVITDADVKDMFNRTTVILEDGVVPVTGRRIGWKRTNRGLLGAIYANPDTGARFLFAPDLRKKGAEPVCLAQLA